MPAARMDMDGRVTSVVGGGIVWCVGEVEIDFAR